MDAALSPASPEEVLAAVRWALAGCSPLEVVGHGSKRGIGRPVEAAATLDLSRLTGVTLYEPEELVLSARAGTPLAEVEALLAEHGQELAFEPMDFGPLSGGVAGRGTIGGVLAANVSGPRRLKAGAARDHVLGIAAVSGRGEAFKSGGRVVKNVTGYDLSKGLAGSWGTLAVVTDVTFKVLPKAETEATLVLPGLSDLQAAAAMALALGSSAEVSGAAHLPENIAPRVLDGALAGAAADLAPAGGRRSLRRLPAGRPDGGAVRRLRPPAFVAAAIAAALARAARLPALRRRHRAPGLAGLGRADCGPPLVDLLRREAASTPSTTGRAGWSGCAWTTIRPPRRCAG